MTTRPIVPITLDRIDYDAVKVVRRLTSCGFEAYIVGGCVRDLLLGERPKDFDVATNATPAEIRRIFRNCRIIGRRFRLAHIFFGPKVIETSTFRATPAPLSDATDPLIWRDNEFGTAEEDALRRDFTINALYFDPNRLELFDPLNGFEDLKRGILRSVGDPNLRFPEDPVRILRAAKFAARLQLTIEPSTYEAMIHHRELIGLCSISRLLEEIYKLLRSGSSEKTFKILRETQILPVLFPELAVFIGMFDAHAQLKVPFPTVVRARGQQISTAESSTRIEVDVEEFLDEDADLSESSLESSSIMPEDEHSFSSEFERTLQLLNQISLNHDESPIPETLLWDHLASLDHYCKGESIPPSPPILLAAMLSPLLYNALTVEADPYEASLAIDRLVQAVGQRIQISRRHRDQLKKIFHTQRRLTGPHYKPTLRKRDYFDDAIRLLTIRHRADTQQRHPQLASAISRWTRSEEQQKTPRSRRRSRHRRR